MYDLKEIITQAERDNQHNLIDIIKVTELPPYELKRQFGKGLWKTLCGNSKTRNKQISRVIKVAINSDAPTNFSFKDISILNNLTQNKIKCILFIHKNDQISKGLKIIDMFKFSCVHEEGITKRDFNHLYSTLLDTIRMSKNLGQPFNNSWSFKRIKKEHDRLSILGRAKSFGPSVDEEIQHAVDFEGRLTESINNYYGSNPICRELRCDDGFIFSYYHPRDILSSHMEHNYDNNMKMQNQLYLQARIFERTSYKITVLKTPKDYIEESNRMNHCIWSYAKDAQSGRYLAFHIDEYYTHRDGSGRILFDESLNKTFRDSSNRGFTLGLRSDGRDYRYYDPDINYLDFNINPEEQTSTQNYKTRFNYNVEQVYGHNNSPIPSTLTAFLEFILSEFTDF